jgi:hypothetical protein
VELLDELELPSEIKELIRRFPRMAGITLFLAKDGEPYAVYEGPGYFRSLQSRNSTVYPILFKNLYQLNKAFERERNQPTTDAPKVIIGIWFASEHEWALIGRAIPKYILMSKNRFPGSPSQ